MEKERKVLRGVKEGGEVSAIISHNFEIFPPFVLSNYC